MFMAIKKHKYAKDILFLSLLLLYISVFIQNKVMYNYQEKAKKCQVEEK